MLDKFKARLKAKTKAAGVNLSQKRIDAYAARLHKKHPDATEDADHDSAIDELDELVDFKEIAKEDDRVRTLEARNRKPADEDPDEEEEEQNDQPARKPKKKPTSDEPPAWAKSMLEEFQALKNEKKVSSIREKLAAKLKDKQIPEKFYSKRALPEKEEDLDDFVSEIETDWTDLKQENNNLGLGGVTPASGQVVTKQANVDKDIEAWAGSKEEKK